MRSLRFLQWFLLKLQRCAIRKSKLWLIALCILTSLAILFANHIKVLLSINDLIDSDFQTYGDLKHLDADFSDKNDLFLDISAQGRAINRAELCGVQKWLIDSVDGQQPYRKMFSSFGVKKTVETEHSWFTKNILDPQCDKLSPTNDIESQLKEIRQSPWGSSLTSKDAHNITIGFNLSDAAGSTRFGSFDPDAVSTVLESFKKSISDHLPELKVHFAGVALHQFYLKKGLEQTALINLVLPLVVSLLFWVFYADIRPGIIFFGTISIATVLIYGVMGALGVPLDILTNILTLMLVLSSLEDFLFLLHFSREKPDAHWRFAFRKLLVPSFFTSLTTAIGFASLASSDLAIVRRFGLLAAVAALLEWVLVFLILPAILQKFGAVRRWMKPNPSARFYLRSTLETLTRLNLPRVICIGLLFTYLLSPLVIGRIQTNDSPARIFPNDHILIRDLDSIQLSHGWESQVSLVFKNFENSTFNRAVIEQLKKESDVVAIESPYEVEDYLTAPLTSSNTSLVKQLWVDAPFASRLIARNGTARAIVLLRSTDTTTVDKLRQTSNQLCGQPSNCYLAGSLVSYAEFGDRVLATLISSLGVSLLLVCCVLWYLLRSRRHSKIIKTLASAFWGPCALVFFFWCFDFKLTYVTCTFASVVVGLAGDNTIQYLFATPKSENLSVGIKRQGAASLEITIVMIMLSLLFLGSYFESVRSLAPLFVLGFVLTLVGDLWLYKFLNGD